jgi:hypothetical protein
VEKPLTRRTFVRLLASLPLAAAAPAYARRGRIERLIAQASALPTAAERMTLISAGLLGARYRANTLIGGPRRREVLVVRDDAFDCVTFCEVVLAAASVGDHAAFAASLRGIRYARGEVIGHARNHYFADWTRRAVENGICQPAPIAPAVTIEKTVNWQNLGKRRVTLSALSATTLTANIGGLASGDVIGFVSRRPSLDVFHTGLIMRDKDNVMLRHASRSRGRVVDEQLERIVAANRVQHVTLVRPVEPLVPAKQAV